MIAPVRSLRLLACAGLALALVVPVAGCESKEKAPVIDTTTPIKNPAPPTSVIVTPEPKEAR